MNIGGYFLFVYQSLFSIYLLTMQDVENQSVTIEKQQKKCPYWAELVPCVFLILLDIYVCKYKIDIKFTEWRFPIFCYVFAGLCFGWWLLLIISRIVQSGVGGFYDMYWYCNVGLLITAIGVAFGIPSLIGQSMCLLLLPHMTFWIDVTSYPCFKVCPFNAYPYMFDKETPFMEKFTSYHHFWYFPGLILVLWKQPLLSLWSYGLSILLFAFLNIMALYMTPKVYVYKDGSTRYLNVCQAHEYPEFVKKIPPFKYTVGKNPLYMFFVTTTCYITPGNLISYFIIIGFQYLVKRYL